MEAGQAIKDKWQVLEDLFLTALPQVCSLCQRRIVQGAFPSGICSFCLDELPLRPPDKCFEMLQQPGQLGQSAALPLFTAFYYDGSIRQAVTGLKFHERMDFAILIGDLLAQFWQREKRYRANTRQADWLEAEVLIPVPLHAQRLRDRGYNQVELFAGQMAKNIGCSLDTDSLLRQKHTSRQSETVHREERLANVDEAFVCSAESTLRGKHIILMDDVISTGATLWQAALPLLKRGNQVTLLTLAGNRPIDSSQGKSETITQ